MKKLILPLLTAAFLLSSVTHAYECPSPNSATKKAFMLIEAPHLGNFEEHLKTHMNLITKNSQNIECETLYYAAIRTKNESARQTLDTLDFGPKEVKELVYGIPYVWYSIYEYALKYSDIPVILELTRRGGYTTGSGYVKTEKTELMVAIDRNSIELLQGMIESGANVHRVNVQQTTALMYAAKLGKLDFVKALIQKGSDPLQLDATGNTLLHYAARSKSIDTLKFAGQFKIDVNQESFGRTALTWASTDGTYEMVDHLLQKGAYLEPVDSYYLRSPLMWAAAHNPDPKVFELLLKKGANPYRKAKNSTNLLMFASANPHTSAIVDQCLSLGFDVNSSDLYNYSAILFAAMYGTKGAIQSLVKAGADVYHMNLNDENALMLAADKGNSFEVIQELLTYKFNVNQRSSAMRMTALILGAENLSFESLQALIQAGAKRRYKNTDGMTAYAMAKFYRRDQKILRLLRP